MDGKDSSFGSVRGNITDLSDLAQMVNLEELALCNQKIEDISGLKELPLKKLYLSKNMITVTSGREIWNKGLQHL